MADIDALSKQVEELMEKYTAAQKALDPLQKKDDTAPTPAKKPTEDHRVGPGMAPEEVCRKESRRRAGL